MSMWPRSILDRLEVRTSDKEFVDASELFRDAYDSVKGPALSFKVLRERSALTQTEMAEKLGVSQGDISKIEKGERRIGSKLAIRIGKAMKIDYKLFL